MRDLRIGVIGAGYMGKAHAIGLKAAATVFDLPLRPVCEMIATTSDEGAAAAARALGFNRSTGDWRALVADPDVDAINISTPPWTHREMVDAAAAAGKPIFCEKPLGRDVADAEAILAAVERAGVPNMVGFNYIRTPASQLAREIVLSGEIGTVVHFRGAHVEDYMLDPTEPGGWRIRKDVAGEAGALSDVGAHIFNAALRLVGPVESLTADLGRVWTERGGEACENDDHGHLLLRFRSGAIGTIQFSRIAAGRKMGYAYEIGGTRGTVAFDQENQNAVDLYTADGPSGRRGFRRLLVGPEHPDYGAFCQGSGHGTGYNDMMVIEARDFVEAVARGIAVWPTFRDGLAVDRMIGATLRSAAERRWVQMSEFEAAS